MALLVTLLDCSYHEGWHVHAITSRNKGPGREMILYGYKTLMIFKNFIPFSIFHKQYICTYTNGKGKAIPVTGNEGP
jgi:hypothetical protein